MTLPRLTALLLPLALLGPGCGGSTDVLKPTPVAISLSPDPYRVNPEPSTAANSVAVQRNCPRLAAPAAGKTTFGLGAGLVAVAVVEPLVKIAIDAFDSQLKEDLEKYTETHQASIVADEFYAPGRVPQFPCFHLKREPLAEKGGRGAMEFVGKIEPAGPRALRVRPLYLSYPSQPAAELGPDGVLGLSINLKMDALWQGDAQGLGGTRFDVPVLEDRLVFEPGRSFEQSYRDRPGVLVPLLPWAGGNSTAVYTVTVTEVGKPSQVLTWLRRVVVDGRDKAASEIAAAAEAGL